MWQVKMDSASRTSVTCCWLFDDWQRFFKNVCWKHWDVDKFPWLFPDHLKNFPDCSLKQKVPDFSLTTFFFPGHFFLPWFLCFPYPLGTLTCSNFLWNYGRYKLMLWCTEKFAIHYIHNFLPLGFMDLKEWAKKCLTQLLSAQGK